MPWPAAVAGAVVAGGSQIAGSGINAWMTGKMNRKSREFSREMYQRQYHDNVNFWNMQNEYNSPQAQMQRFQEAGLNPHLIYGQGNGGNAGAISTPDVQPAQFRTPEWGNGVQSAGLSMMQYFDIEIKQAQAKNLQAQNEVIKQDAALKVAQIRATMTNEERQRFDLEFERGMANEGISGDARREKLRQTKVSTDLALNEDVRRATMNASNVQEAAERIASMHEARAKSRAERDLIRYTIANAKRDGTLKDIEIRLRKQGINPNDPMWQRQAGLAIQEIFSDIPSISGPMGNAWKWLKNKIR